jgi:hypothetical protein
LVHLVGFIIRYITMHGPLNVKISLHCSNINAPYKVHGIWRYMEDIFSDDTKSRLMFVYTLHTI